MSGKRRRRIVAWTALLAVASLAIWSTAIEPGLLRTRTVLLESPHWPEARPALRIVFIADLHIGSPHITLAKLDEIVAEANAATPDIVLLGGDYVAHVLGGRSVPPEEIAARLGKLKARYAVVSVLGNHDHWNRQGEQMRQALEAARILVLENEARRVQTDAGMVWVVGVGSDLGGHASTVGAFRDVPLGAAEPVLVLAHDPGIFYEIPRGVAAIFTGHTHGGQVRLPLVGALVNASRAPLSHSYGVIREHGKVMFVTAGIGTSVLPIRFNCPPEIAVLTIRAEPLKR